MRTQAGQVVFSRDGRSRLGQTGGRNGGRRWVTERGAERVFLMVSGTLNRTTDEIDKLRRALGQQIRRYLRQDAAAHAAGPP